MDPIVRTKQGLTEGFNEGGTFKLCKGELYHKRTRLVKCLKNFPPVSVRSDLDDYHGLSFAFCSKRP